MNKIEDCEIVNFSSLLEPEENIVWQGRHKHLIPFSGMNVSFTVIGIVLFLAAGYSATLAIQKNVLYVLLSVVLGLMSYFFTFYRLVNLYKHNKNTFFILTNRRAIQYTAGRKEIIAAHTLSNESIVEVKVNKKGHGTIRIEPTYISDASRNPDTDNDPTVDWMKGFNPDIDFEDIDEADTVTYLINDVIKNLYLQAVNTASADEKQNFDRPDFHNAGIVQRWLRPGERILWQGRPDPRYKITKDDARPIPVGFVFLCFAVLWMVMASRNSLLLGVYGIPFICIGLNYSVIKFIKGIKKYKNIYYAVTNKRVITGLKNESVECVQELKLNDIFSVDMSVKKDNTGTILLNGNYIKLYFLVFTNFSKAAKNYNNGKIKYMEIYGISNVDMVSDLINRITAGN